VKSITSEEENVEIARQSRSKQFTHTMSNDLYRQYRIYYLLNFFFLCLVSFHVSLFDRPRLTCCKKEKVRLQYNVFGIISVVTLTLSEQIMKK
jgi:hypothetical protein